ncbi:MAG: NAD kinase, partial [Actinobacteria bacterium]|nr:NAD kinase [Actinomycetota bacterium]
MSKSRFVLVVTHTAREEAIAAAAVTFEQMIAGGITPVISATDLADLKKITGDQLLAKVIGQIKTLEVDCQISELELVVVLGGDGTILKAAEIVRDYSIPLMGINLGHVGFLAESEREEFTEAVRRVLDHDYEIKERLTLEVAVFVDGQEVFRTWALNEATVEKNARERMLEVVLEIEGHPLSSFGCDGVVMSTPTGSTAYAFSAGGPVVWPSVEALLVVPLSAHALFARPLVVKPDAMVAVEVLQRSAGHGILWCDGRRSWELPPGARVEVTKSSKPVRLARLRTSTFTDRLV